MGDGWSEGSHDVTDQNQIRSKAGDPRVSPGSGSGSSAGPLYSRDYAGDYLKVIRIPVVQKGN